MNEALPMLALETSGELCSVTTLVKENVYSEVNLNFKNIHSEKIIALVEQSLNNAGITGNELKSIAVSIGPGSFTGLRIGLATAKGLAMGWNLPICPVNTMDAMALQISEFVNVKDDFFLVVNANLEEAYLARYQKRVTDVSKLEEIQSVKKKHVSEKIGDSLVYGNLEGINGLKYFSGVRSLYIAKWAYLFGKDLLNFNFDYLEPRYFKEFLPGGVI